MRIAYIFTRPIPSKQTDTQQVMKTVDALGAEGVEIDLFVPRSYLTLRSKLADYENRVRHFYSVNNRFGLKPILSIEPSRLELERPLHGLLASLRCKGRGYDVIYTRSRSAVLSCTALRMPVVFETYRLPDREHSPLGPLLRMSWRSRYFLGVFTHSRQSFNSIHALGVPEQKIAVVYNGYDPADLEPLLSKREARAKLRLDPNRPLVCYAGNVQPNKGISAVLEIAALTPEIGYLIVGGQSADLARLQARIDRDRLDNVRCPGWQTADKLSQYMYASDVLIIPPTALPLEQYGRTVLPMKTFIYLAAGRADSRASFTRYRGDTGGRAQCRANFSG